MFCFISAVEQGWERRLLLTDGFLERYILLDEHLPERFRWTARKDGCVREQGRNIQAGGDDNRDCVSTMVHMGPLLLRSVGRREVTAQEPGVEKGGE